MDYKADYKIMYLRLFNKVTDAVRLLMSAQRAGETVYLDDEDIERLNLNLSDSEKPEK